MRAVACTRRNTQLCFFFRHKKKFDHNGNVWYDSESSEDSDCDDEVDIGDLPAGSFKRIPCVKKTADHLCPSQSKNVEAHPSQTTITKKSATDQSQKTPQYEAFGPSMFGFGQFGMF